LDRRRAIELSLAIAAPGDCVVIAGGPLVRRPGHVRPVADRKVVETCLQSLNDAGRKSIA
jgi:hypothetical protein